MPPLGIYIHIPFCLKRCAYCDFLSVPVGRGEVPHEGYLSALVGQMDGDAMRFGLDGRRVSTVYFGGGTPSLMPLAFFERILSAISRSFSLDPDAEISCEVNPATADEAWFKAARRAGITRLSIGIQSFDPGLLATLGRIHSPEDARRAVAGAMAAGFDSVGVDIMYAIPGETLGILEEDLNAAMGLGVGHISAYQLTIEDGTPLAARLGASALWAGTAARPFELPSEDEALDQMRMVAKMLGQNGWGRYEISNFARPGHECRHSLNCWRYGEYLGLGAGAASFLHAADEAETFGWRTVADRGIARYIAGGSSGETEEIGIETAMGEFSFLALRTMEGIDAGRFTELFGTPIEGRYGEALEELTALRLMEREAGRYRLTDRGIELSDQAFARFV